MAYIRFGAKNQIAYTKNKTLKELGIKTHLAINA